MSIENAILMSKRRTNSAILVIARREARKIGLLGGRRQSDVAAGERSIRLLT